MTEVQRIAAHQSDPMSDHQDGESDTEYRSGNWQVVECELSCIGCKEKFPLKDQDEHMERNTQKHLSLMATATLRKDQQIQEMKQVAEDKDKQLQEQLKVRDNELTKKLQVKDQQIRELQDQVQQQLQEKDAETKQAFEDKTLAVSLLVVIVAVAAVFLLAPINTKVDTIQQQLPKLDQKLKQLQEQGQQIKEFVDKQLQVRDTELTKKLQVKDQQIRELQENHKQFQQQLQEKDAEMKQELKTRDDELTKKLQVKDKQITEVRDKLQQKLEEKDEYLQKELKKRDDELKLKLEEKDQQMRAVEEKLQKELQERDQKHAAEVTALKKQSQETDTKFSEAINTLHMTCIPPYHFTMANYKQLKAEDTYWYSEHFYTHPRGYKCEITVWPNGLGEGSGTHVGVSLYSIQGEFDATLPWPAEATITLQLLNQHRDQDHVTVTKRFELKKPNLILSWHTCVGHFSDTFIPHAELDWNAQKQTQYLKDDCLRFRITKIEIQ